MNACVARMSLIWNDLWLERNNLLPQNSKRIFHLILFFKRKRMFISLFKKLFTYFMKKSSMGNKNKRFNYLLVCKHETSSNVSGIIISLQHFESRAKTHKKTILKALRILVNQQNLGHLAGTYIYMNVCIFPPRSEFWNSCACIAHAMQSTPKAACAVYWAPAGKQQPSLGYFATGDLKSHHMLWDARQS